MQIQPVSKDFAESLGLPDEKGAFVSNINPEGPSKKAGLEAGDVILRFNDIEIVKMIDLPRVVAESDVGSIATVEIWRKNKIIKIEVKLGELPEETYVKRGEKPKIDQTEITSLGITITETKNNEGVVVTKIYDDNSKLILKDVITEINREKISDTKSFKLLVDKIQKTGRSSLLLKIIRDQEFLWITIKFKVN